MVEQGLADGAVGLSTGLEYLPGRLRRRRRRSRRSAAPSRRPGCPMSRTCAGTASRPPRGMAEVRDIARRPAWPRTSRTTTARPRRWSRWWTTPAPAGSTSPSTATRTCGAARSSPWWRCPRWLDATDADRADRRPERRGDAPPDRRRGRPHAVAADHPGPRAPLRMGVDRGSHARRRRRGDRSPTRRSLPGPARRHPARPRPPSSSTPGRRPTSPCGRCCATRPTWAARTASTSAAIRIRAAGARSPVTSAGTSANSATGPGSRRRCTSPPTPRAGSASLDRGLIRPGLAADLAVIDPVRVADRADYATPREPAVGVDDVIVNGVPVLRDGQLTGALAGLPLKPYQGA